MAGHMCPAMAAPGGHAPLHKYIIESPAEGRLPSWPNRTGAVGAPRRNAWAGGITGGSSPIRHFAIIADGSWASAP